MNADRVATGALCSPVSLVSPARQGVPAADRESTLLIVEDEPEILEPLAYSLRRQGYRVIEAVDGLAACRLIGNEQPDLVLLDLMLPDLDGWQVCEMLRRHPDETVAGTPLVMLTALGDPAQRRRGLALGADAYLVKPCPIKELLQVVAELIGRNRRSDWSARQTV
ncbi:MAG: response regulator [Desulfuromonadales bacterium]|nr:response regulator [Desulfuromonadales bacterium]